MNKSESKYYNTACLMDEALMQLLLKKDFEYITVKEICIKAGVNRSTFYLHYDSTKDLLLECNTILQKKFEEKFSFSKLNSIDTRIDTLELNDLVFINREYLEPYLTYVQENKTLYKAIYKYPELFNSNKNYMRFFKLTFQPILKRFGTSGKDAIYIMDYFITGIFAIITRWVKDDCRDSIDKIIEIIIKCIRPNLS